MTTTRPKRQRKPPRFTRRELDSALGAAKAAGFRAVEVCFGELRLVFSDGAVPSSAGDAEAERWKAA
jgi:hypothetical protein